MPIIAVCPYCQQGKVRAPERAVGMCIPCPKCKSHFTITPPDRMAAANPATRTATVAATETATYPAIGARPQDAPPAPPIPDPDPDPPVPLAAVVPPPADSPGVDPGLPWALVAFTLVGVGLVGSQFPYGRFVTTGLGGLGVLVGLLGVLAAERRKEIPLAAAGAGLLAALVAVFLPGMLLMTTWRPVDVADESKLVKSVGRDGEVPMPADWVDAAKAAWQWDDVRVAVKSATAGPVESVGPKGVKKASKDKVLQIALRVTNVGVARKFDFLGWDVSAAPVPDAVAPKLTDWTGKAVPPKRFEPGWEPAAKPERSGPLYPGRAAEYVLLFEAPPKLTGDLRLELPGAAFGSDVPVKLLIPATFVVGTR